MENWKNLMHVFVTIFLSNFASLLVNPTIADVTMEAVCPGKDECSLSIYLSGFQQAIAGLASVVMMPLIGNLSDTYGRKLLLTIPLTLAIIPFVILATKRTTEFFYVYYVVKTLTSTVTDGGTICLALSYMFVSVVCLVVATARPLVARLLMLLHRVGDWKFVVGDCNNW
ncbi:uncharacterized protein LOC121809018 [Salvia splendens]|uniref:uncharacterized protein LOC121809018 n=1 Tax=Salvia splendens TaxID=180675 RepID=UPI001C265979|nr:uncharacterized protein LOC121809018 [Salvia splendens]